MPLPTRLLLAALLLPSLTSAQSDSARLARRTVTVAGATYPYVVLLPQGYDRQRPWPVILALHGSGARGSDGMRQVDRALGAGVRRAPDRFAAIVVFPQVPREMTWQGLGTEVALGALDGAIAEFGGDAERTYLMGVSMGGNGVWAVAWQQPQRFAAIVALCGWVVERRGSSGSDYAAIAPDNSEGAVAARFRTIPVWLFHGDADTQVPTDHSRRLRAAFERAGAPVRYTELPGMGHNIADSVLAKPELTQWLMAQRRSGAR